MLKSQSTISKIVSALRIVKPRMRKRFMLIYFLLESPSLLLCLLLINFISTNTSGVWSLWLPEHMLHKYFPSQFIWEVFFHARISSQPLFHLKNPTMQDFYRSFNRDCELVSQLPIILILQYVFIRMSIASYVFRIVYCGLMGRQYVECFAYDGLSDTDRKEKPVCQEKDSINPAGFKLTGYFFVHFQNKNLEKE